MSFSKHLLWFLLLPFLWSSPAHAVACSGTSVHGAGNHACYAIAAGSWNTTTVWSATSGGGSCGCTIATGDELIFDANTPAGTYTDSAISLASVDATAAGAGVTLAGTQAITISGLFYGTSAALTDTMTGLITFTSTTGTTVIKTGGLTYAHGITLNGSGGTFQIGGDTFGLKLDASHTLTLTAGTLDNSTNNTAIQCGVCTLTAGTSNLGSGSVTAISTSGTTLSTSGTTLSAASATLAINAASITATRTLQLGTSQSVGTISITGNATTFCQYLTYTTAVTIGTLTLTGPLCLIPPSATTITLSNAPTWAGASGSQIFIGTTGGVGAVITWTITGTPAISWVNSTGNAWSGSGTCTNCLDIGHNTGMTFIAPTYGAGGGGGHIIGG